METQHRTPHQAPPRRMVPTRVVAVGLALAASTLTPGLALAQEADLDAIRATVDEHVEAARAALASELFEGLDPDMIVAGVGGDPVALRDWVAHETSWVPYLGTLRGSDGVLADGSGNSLDRSLLLADLLARAGIDARLARAVLPAELSAALVEGLAGSLLRPRTLICTRRTSNNAPVWRPAPRLWQSLSGSPRALSLSRTTSFGRPPADRLVGADRE